MILNRLSGLAYGEAVTLKCRTTPANIFLKKGDNERHRCVPEPVQLLPIPYLASGQWQGISQENEIAYAVLLIDGEAAVLQHDGECMKVVDKVIRPKLQHIPLSAIYDL